MAFNPASYQSPGVYVKEVDSGIKAISGVSTSTAAFIGVLTEFGSKTATVKEEFKGDGAKKDFTLKNYPIVEKAGAYRVLINGVKANDVELKNDSTSNSAVLSFKSDPPDKETNISITYEYKVTISIVNENLGKGDGKQKVFELTSFTSTSDQILSSSVTVDGAPVSNATLGNNNDNTKVIVTFSSAPVKDKPITITYKYFPLGFPANTPVLCTSFSEFKTNFFDLSVDQAKSFLAQSVLGFFNNGGSRCYVICTDSNGMDNALQALESIDEIALVAAPGQTEVSVQKKLIDHCAQSEGIFYRFAILDGPDKGVADETKLTRPGNTDYAAWYFPWIKVADPSNPKNTLSVPPSGHIAGIYARVDSNIGVHKAPANEVIRGALDVTQPLSRPQQDGLNPKGINCIRLLNSNILVWGARTLGGNDNQDLKYVNVRRTLLFLRKSIDQSTQWVVFEPNTPALWQKITRNVIAFLTTVWRSGALFGNTAEEAFYVKCDAENNPPDVREAGAVVTEIGVAIARPAEFVIFHISQWTGPNQ
jgi:uncharacterized protein